MKAIVVNGASSAGCTSLVTGLCAVTKGCFRAVHLDRYLSALPAGMWERCGDTDKGWVEIGMAFNQHLADLTEAGEVLIADSFYKRLRPIEHLFATLGRENVFFVQLFCTLPELERRERARGDRRIGLARHQFGDVYSFQGYDLLIDSTDLSVGKCVQRLVGELPDRLLQGTGEHTHP